MKKMRHFIVLAVILASSGTAVASQSYSPFSLSFDLTGQGAFTGDDTIPLSAGIGGNAFLDWRPLDWISFGTGLSYKDFPGDNPWQVASLDLGGRLFPFGSGDAGEWYLQGGVGYNLISHNLAKNDAYPGYYHAMVGLGYRAMLGSGMALDLGPQYDFYTPFLHMPNINSIGLKLGITWLLGKSPQAVNASAVTQNVPVEQTTTPNPTAENMAATSMSTTPTPVAATPTLVKEATTSLSAKESATPVPAEEAEVSVEAPAEGEVEALKTGKAGSVAKAPVTQYSVVKGDTLWGISGKDSIYRDSFQWPLIFHANRDLISDPDLIYPRQSFHIGREYSSEDIERARKLGGDTPKYVPHSKPREALPLDYF